MIGGEKAHILSIVDKEQFARILERLKEEIRTSFFPITASAVCRSTIKTIRSPSATAACVTGGGRGKRSKLKGGNSNWRGPIWFPTSYLLVESLLKFREAHGGGLGLQDLAEDVARTPHRDFQARQRGPQAHCSAVRKDSRPIPTGATIFSFTSISAATTVPESAPATKPAGPLW